MLAPGVFLTTVIPPLPPRRDGFYGECNSVPGRPLMAKERILHLGRDSDNFKQTAPLPPHPGLGNFRRLSSNFAGQLVYVLHSG